ncbi:MAG: hypothetical protein M5U12_31965 [Verrucomicrobia bacterium]|nr:hypothetical protein [Verrucomicrobiota bacterium]
MLELEEADVAGAGLIGGVELLDELLDDEEVFRAGGDDERVGAGIGGEGEGVAGAAAAAGQGEAGAVDP